MTSARLPWARAERLRLSAADAATAEPEDPLDRAFFYAVRGQDPKSPAVEVAFDLAHAEERHVLNALLLCGAPEEEVRLALRLGEGVYDAYRQLFFDPAVFRNVFEARRFLRVYTEVLPDEAKEVYNLALLEGYERLLDRYRIGAKPIPSVTTVAEAVMAEHYGRAFEHRGRPLTSRTAQESFKWGRSAASAAMALQAARTTGKADELINAVRFALATKDHTQTIEEAGLDPDAIIKG